MLKLSPAKELTEFDITQIAAMRKAAFERIKKTRWLSNGEENPAERNNKNVLLNCDTLMNPEAMLRLRQIMEES